MKTYQALIILLLITLSNSAFSQTLVGEWFGIGKVNRKGEHSNYLAEMTLKQKGNTVTGVFSYYFKSAKVSNKVVGHYDAKFKLLEIQFTPVLNHKAKNINGADCPMEGSFTVYIADEDTTMYGQFNPSYNYRYTCGPITINFRKVSEKTPIEIQNYAVVKEEEAPIEIPLQQPKIDPALLALNNRAFDVIDEVEVTSDTLLAILYDNSEVDNDTVSLFYDKQVIASKNMLSDKPINFKLPVADTGVNEISMYAENLGSLPPNTALLIIMDGERRLEFNLVSNYIKNSSIRFRKKKPNNTTGKL